MSKPVSRNLALALEAANLTPLETLDGVFRLRCPACSGDQLYLSPRAPGASLVCHGGCDSASTLDALFTACTSVADTELYAALQGALCLVKFGSGTPAPEPRKRATSTAMVATEDDADPRFKWVYDKRGMRVLAPGAHNQVALLRYSEKWSGKIRLNEFTNEIELTDPPWIGSMRPGTNPVHDTDAKLLQQWYQWDQDLAVGSTEAWDALCTVAREQSYNPVRDWMETLQWDGTLRLARWLTDYLGAPEDEYTSSVGKWWLTSAVARTYAAGCKADCMLILYGRQGAGKSSALRILAGDSWFSDTPFDIENEQRAGQALCGVLIYEFGELASWTRAEQGRVKGFCSSADDKYREPYGKVSRRHPRRCVFAGTTNHDDFLRDETGARRFWPVGVGNVDLASLQTDREQLWAEAVAVYKRGERWWPEGTENALMAEVQERHRSIDAWEDKIYQWLEGRDEVSLIDVMCEGLGILVGNSTRGDQMRVSAALKSLKWERFRARRDGELTWLYRRGAE